MGRHPFFVLLSCNLQGSSMSIIQLNGALQGDHGSLTAAPAHICVPKLTHIAVPKQNEMSRCAQTHLLILFSFDAFYVVPLPLLGDEVHEELPNRLTAASGLLCHPFLLFLRLLPQVGNLSFCIG